MQRLATAVGSLSVAALGFGCATQECGSLTDCPTAQMCSPDGRCIADDRDIAPALRAGGGGVGRWGDPRDQDFGGGTLITVEDGDAVIDGDIGPVRGFEAAPAALSIWEDDTFAGAIIDLRTEAPVGFGLVLLSLPNGLATLTEGTTTLTGGGDLAAPYVQLCSDDADTHFDAIADEAIVTVTPRDDDGLDVVVEATFEGQVARAELTVPR